MRAARRGLKWLVLATAWSTAAVCGAQAQPPADESGSAIQQLALEQSRIADKYARLEQLLIRRAELEATTNPQRAALLKRAAQQSTERLMRNQLNSVSALLAPPARFQQALDEQRRVLLDLQELLTLLLSEDRSDRLRNEASRIREYIKEVDRLIRLQRSLEGRTEGGGDPERLAGEQGQVAERTGDLAERIQENEETSPTDSPGERPDPGEEKSPAESPREGEPAEPPPPGGEPGKSPAPGETPAPPRADTPPSEPGAPAPSEPSGDNAPMPRSPSGQPTPGQPGEPSPAQDAPPQEAAEEGNPARRRIQAAEQRMREAQKKLQEAQRRDAQQEQEEARRELEKAKAELEQILRQLREEEVERMLALLEGRFRQMYEAQLKIYEATQQLDQASAEEPLREIEIRAGKLSFDENKLIVEADKVLTLLHEEASSVAFPESVAQMRDDMEFVSQRLGEGKVDALTQGTEEDILAALEEMIAALQLAQREREEQQQQQQQSPSPVDPQDMPLVNRLAELKMIRALQMRVNRRTETFAERLVDKDDPVGPALDEDLRAALRRLAERQQRVYEITKDIVLNKVEG